MGYLPAMAGSSLIAISSYLSMRRNIITFRKRGSQQARDLFDQRGPRRTPPASVSRAIAANAETRDFALATIVCPPLHSDSQVPLPPFLLGSHTPATSTRRHGTFVDPSLSAAGKEARKVGRTRGEARRNSDRRRRSS